MSKKKGTAEERIATLEAQVEELYKLGNYHLTHPKQQSDEEQEQEQESTES